MVKAHLSKICAEISKDEMVKCGDCFPNNPLEGEELATWPRDGIGGG